MNNKLRFLVVFILVLISCSPKTKEEAFEKYRDLLENRVWCEIESKDRFIFKDGYCKQVFENETNHIGKYELNVKPVHGLGNKWFRPIRSIEINTQSGKNYSFELGVNSNKGHLSFRNSKDKSMLFLSDDCILNYSDSISYVLSKEHNYKMIDLK